MDRCKYFLDNKLNCITGWKSERTNPRRKKNQDKILLTEEDNE